MKKHFRPPQWVQDTFIHKRGTYEHWFLLWSCWSEEHRCYEVMLSEDDRGFTVSFGSCSCSYAGDFNSWNRVYMGRVEDWDALKAFVHSMLKRTKEHRIWENDDRKYFNK